MISLKHAHAIPQAVSLALGLCFAAVLIFAAATPARAQSAGCTTLAGGGGNTTIPTGTVVNTTVNVTADAGETITVTVTGNPNSVRIGTNPGNVRLFSGPGNQTVTVTLPAGITGITISGQAGGGGPTQVNFTCTSPTATTGSGSTTQTQTGPTPDETSDAVDNAGSQIDSGRLPTSPAGLPTAVGDSGLFQDPYAAQRNELEELNAELAATEASIKKNKGNKDKLIIATMEEMEQHDTEGERFQFDPQMRKVYNELSDDMAILEERKSQLLKDKRKLEDFLKDKLTPEDIVDALDGGEIILLAPDSESGSYNFSASTDGIRLALALRLDEEGASAPANLPPLTIGGMPVNIWVRGRGTIFDRQKRAGSDGWSAHLLSGVALRVTDDLVLGGFGSYLTGESDQKATGTEVKSDQIGGGLYGRLRLTDSLSAGISASRESGEQDIKTPTATGSTDTRLWTVSGSLSGSWAVDPVILTPSVSVSYADSKRDAYTDSTGTLIPGSSSQDTTIGSALTVSRSFVHEDGWIRRATPRLNATLNYFAREKDTLRLSATEVIDRDNWGANIGAGVTLTTSGSSRLSFDAGVIGIGQDTLGYTGQLQLEIGF